MFNTDLHKSNLIAVLRGIFSDPVLRNMLGFKGGTAALLFYNLPRLSVDLDFDLLDVDQKEVVFQKLKTLLANFGELRVASDKRSTLFFLLNYKKGDRNLKIDISKRPVKSEFVIKNYLGVSMLVMSEADMVAGKFAALLTRKRFASRDMFDLWFFLKENWPINDDLLKEKSGLSIKQALKKAQVIVKNIKKTELLSGLGELLNNKQKAWVREKLQNDLIFYLKLYESLLKP